MTQGTGDRPLEILLVEDSPADARLAQETIQGSEHPTNITHAEDGAIALSMLRNEGEHAGAAKPDLILLDLRMPNKDGMEVLKELSKDEELSKIPVVVLTGTEAEQSLLSSYNVPPSRYWRKPIDLQRFELALGQLDSMSHSPIKVEGAAPAGGREPVGATSGGGDDGGQKKRWWWPFG